MKGMEKPRVECIDRSTETSVMATSLREYPGTYIRIGYLRKIYLICID